MTINITDTEFNILAEIIHNESGMSHDLKKKYFIENRLGRRLKALKLDSFRRYIEHLGKRSAGRTEMERLINQVTTNETSFFRDQSQLESFVKVVIPEIVKLNRKMGRKRIRIWSAASSTGEEIYTMAIMLREAAIIPSDWSVELYASDINEEVLQKAREAVYSKYSLRNTPEPVINRYFKKEPKGFRLKTNLLYPVNFQKANLLKLNGHALLTGFDVVFCRNVLFYFSMEAKKKALEGIYRSLANPGYLYIGQSECLGNVTKDFSLIRANGISYYSFIFRRQIGH